MFCHRLHHYFAARYIEYSRLSRLGEDDSYEEGADKEDEAQAEVLRQVDGAPAIGPMLRSEKFTYNLSHYDWLGFLVE